jgi:EmrB/QacA subfamily drug resistance transporter
MRPSPQRSVSHNYKWIALSNTTLGMLLASVNGASLLLALPVIFRGIGIDPLAPDSFIYLLWLMMGYALAMAVLVVTFGRLGDMFGRTRMYNLGFAVFTIGSILSSCTIGSGPIAAIELIIFRIVQGIGGAFLFSNSAAILTDAFPINERGLALGLNQISAVAGNFLGILVGGLLSQFGWRWVFLFNVPIGIAGTIWAFMKLQEVGVRSKGSIDWLGNITFGVGLTMLLVGINFGIQPSASSAMSWGTPFVMSMLCSGIALLIIFVFIEQHVPTPMFRIDLFKIRAFAAGNLATLLAAVARGGLLLMMAIWLQGIWLPLHGYDYEVTPLWAGIFMLPSSIGILVAGPLSGRLSDEYGARYFATTAMIVAAVGFLLMMLLPVNFSYPMFALIILLDGLAMGMFMAPNTSAVMNSLPEQHRGAGSGMRSTLFNVGSPLSTAIIFSLMTVGLNASVPTVMYSGLIQHAVPNQIAQQVANAPPVGYLFAAFLGNNPLKTVIPAQVLQVLPSDQAAIITSKTFFPQLISESFHRGLTVVLTFSIVMCLIAAGASWLRGGKYIYHEKAELERKQASEHDTKG